MILVDTAIWIDHLRSVDAVLQQLLDDGVVRLHPYVLGEIMLGHLASRERVLKRLRLISRLKVVTPDRVEFLVERHGLAGSGIGYVDAHLLASARVTPGCTLWTRDRRLSAVAERLGVAHQPLH